MGSLSFRRALILGGITLALAISTDQRARAFYWPNWPGSGLPGTTSDNSTVANPLTSAGDQGVPSGNPVDPIIDPAAPAPEPATLLTGLIGIAAIGLVRRITKK